MDYGKHIYIVTKRMKMFIIMKIQENAIFNLEMVHLLLKSIDLFFHIISF